MRREAQTGYCSRHRLRLRALSLRSSPLRRPAGSGKVET
jgi:hypothetical protein